MRFLPGKVDGVFYKLRDKERSKESAYVLVAFRFLVRPFVSFVSHIARYAPSSTDKSSSLRNQNQLNLIFRTPLISVYRLAMDATRQGDDVAG